MEDTNQDIRLKLSINGNPLHIHSVDKVIGSEDKLTIEFLMGKTKRDKMVLEIEKLTYIESEDVVDGEQDKEKED